MAAQRQLEARVTRFLEALTRTYYRRATPWLPSDFPLREFAAQPWRGQGYIRHLSFQTVSAVKRFLEERAPKHFYYSSARYDQPGVDDMDAKGWRSADIVFDIDADHIPQCSDRVVKLETPLGETSFIDEKCIELAGLHAYVVYSILVDELGFQRQGIRVEFSGHRGFHVTVYLRDSDEEARAGQDYRRELVNYVAGVGAGEETLEPWRGLRLRRGRPQPVPPLVSHAGFRGRVARIAAMLAASRGDREVAAVFLSRDPREAAARYASLRDRVDEYVKAALELARPEVDAQVTVDTKRLIRAPNSINGKTMLLVAPVEPERLRGFRAGPWLSPFQGDDPVRVEALVDTPPLTVLGHRLRLRRGDRPRLPAPVALYLVAKGVAAPAAPK